MGADKKKNRDQNRRVSKEEIRKKVSQLKEVETSKIESEKTTKVPTGQSNQEINPATEKDSHFLNGKTLGARFEPSTFLFAILSGIFGIMLFYNGSHDRDFLWHCKLGEWIAENKSLPTTDIFSWIGMEKSLPYTAHSWLFSLFVGIGNSMMKNPTLVASIVIFFGAFSLFLLIKTYLFPRRNTLSVLLALAVAYSCSNPRPQIWSNFLFVLSILILTRLLENKKSKSWILLPLISLIFANVHGGMLPVLFCFIGLFTLLGSLPKFQISFLKNDTVYSYEGDLSLKGPDGKKKSFNEFFSNLLEYAKHNINGYWKICMVIFLSCLVTSLMNPYGSKLFTWGFTENSSITKMFIGEWQPIALKSVILIPIFILVLYCLMFYKQKINLYKILPTICCIGAASIYQRFIFYAIFVSFVPLSEIVKKINRKGWKTLYWYIIAIALFVFFSSISSDIIQENGTESVFKEEDEVFAYLKEHPAERLYNSHDDGAYLIYHGIPTLIDPRFTDELMKDAILSGSLVWEENTIEKYFEEMQFDAVLCCKEEKTALEHYLRLWDAWEPGFEDERYVLFYPAKEASN